MTPDSPPGPDAVIGDVVPPDLHVMSWNIRRRMLPLGPKADRWYRRAPAVRKLLQTERPTLFGVQEALSDQARFVGASLGSHYRRIGHGRAAGGGGEGCPIFYDSTRLEVLDWAQSALSDRPHESGSISWGNLIPRVVVFARFRDLATAQTFSVVNTHLDALSARSRVRSARAIRAMIAANGLPTLVTGDLNDVESSETMRELLAGGAFADTWHVAQQRVTARWGTFPNYRMPRHGGRRIDWILASPEFRVVRAAINANQYEGRWASDHLAVQSVVRLEDRP